MSLPCWLSQSKLRQPTGHRQSNVRKQRIKVSIRPTLFLYYEESLVSSNLNSSLLRFHCAHLTVHSMYQLSSFQLQNWGHTNFVVVITPVLMQWWESPFEEKKHPLLFSLCPILQKFDWCHRPRCLIQCTMSWIYLCRSIHRKEKAYFEKHRSLGSCGLQ